MHRNPTSNCEIDEGEPSSPARRVSGEMPLFANETVQANEPTDPVASEAPLLTQSEWPSTDELESALLEADPFELADGSKSLTGEIAELFGEFEPRLPRDTLPSPPPSLDEPRSVKLPRGGGLP